MVGCAYFGHALLVELLLPKLKASAPARIVWMSGALEAQAKLDWDDLGCAHLLTVPGSRLACACHACFRNAGSDPLTGGSMHNML